MTTDLRRLSLDDKCAVLAGASSWRTHAFPESGLPVIKLSDGPNGVRGERAGTQMTPSVVLPVGIAQGATWDPELIERLGALLGREARRKGAHVVLAPAVNLHRTPVGGRTFEYFSEDPELTAALAVATVRGVQAQDVAVTVKHFVANDTEIDRMSVDVDVDERVLHELYLRPFEAAVVDGGAWGVMAAYNKVGGTHCCASEYLLHDVLRDQWGFDGFVVSDWYAAGDPVASAASGLTLERPGPARFYGGRLADAVRAGSLPEETVDDLVGQLALLARRTKAAERSADAVEESVDDAADLALCREAAIAGTVLARNVGGCLPLGDDVRHVAVIGPNAVGTRIMGGGSSALRPLPTSTILDALEKRFENVSYARGCAIDRNAPLVTGDRLLGPDGEPGLEVRLVAGTDVNADASYTGRITESVVRLFGSVPAEVGRGPVVLTVRGSMRAQVTGTHTFGVIVSSPADVAVAGQQVLTPDSTLVPGSSFYGYGCEEVLTEVDVAAGDLLPVDVVMAMSRPFGGVHLGLREPQDPDALLQAAVDAARQADAAVVVVGTTDEWETEGHDRSTIALPGAQDELVARVAAVNPRTVVVVNAGAPVAMPWLEDVGAVLIPFFGGQEMGDAVSDVLTGAADPGGRLPTSYPRRLDDCLAWQHYRPVRGVQTYGEGFGIGYRGHDMTGTPALLPFGHGLSYGDCTWGEPSVTGHVFDCGDDITVTVPVTATGARDATVVVQGYVAPVDPPVEREPKTLKAWTKLVVPAGLTHEASLTFGAAAFRRWDSAARRWVLDAGDYRLIVAASAADIRGEVVVRLR